MEEHIPWFLSPESSTYTFGIARALLNGVNTFKPDDPDAVHLVLVQYTGGFLLGVERSGAEDKNVSTWLSTWNDRNFGFSASLEPSVAIGMIHIALAVMRRIRCDGVESPASLKLLDPCTGSGTVSAAARVLGIGSVLSSDLRPNFVLKARSNWESCNQVPGLEDAVMGPEYNAALGSLIGHEEGKILDEREILKLLTERDELRHVKLDRDGAIEIREKLMSAGLTLVEKVKGHVWGTWCDQYGRCGSSEFSPPEAQVQSKHVSFVQDATLPFPDWVEGIDLIVANPPWGKNIGKKEDGIAIVRNLVDHFSKRGSPTMSLLVSRHCFEDIAEFDKDVYAYVMKESAFGMKERPSPSAPAVVERWSLIHHAEIGQSVLMVMAWADLDRFGFEGKIYSSGYMGGRYNAPGLALKSLRKDSE